MTKDEQTIKNLKKLKSFHNGSFGADIDRAIKALEQEPREDAVSRYDAVRIVQHNNPPKALEKLRKLPPVTPTQRWVQVNERLPEDLEPVNITWVNREPEPYYHEIKDKNFVATAIHYRDQWYWYSTTCADYLGEYGSNEIDLVDDAVEIVAWMPLPEAYREVKEEV